MLDADKVKKQRKKGSDNGEQTSEIMAALQSIVAAQQELTERLDDIEQGDGRAAAALRLVNLSYDTDDKHLPGLTRIPLRAARPFALGMTLDGLTDPDIMSGKESLQHRFTMNYFQLLRSVGGEHLKDARETARDELASQGEQGAEEELGG